MELLSRDEPQWVVQPLVDAGLDLEQIRDLVFHLAFEGIVGAAPPSPAGLQDLVADRPPRVQAAWLETVGRLFHLQPPP